MLAPDEKRFARSAKRCGRARRPKRSFGDGQDILRYATPLPTGRPARSGSWKAWLDGYGITRTDSLYQNLTIPSTVTSATLSFWIRIDSAETTTSVAYDKLAVTIRNTSNTVLQTLATYSNLNKNSTYVQKSFDVTGFKGQTIRVYFYGTEDSSLQMSFVIDDTALNVQ